MRRTKTVVIVMVIACLGGGLNAASAGNFEIYLNGAVAFPLAPEGFSDYWNVGVANFGGGIGYSIIPAVSANVYFDWCNFGFDGEQFAHDLGLGGTISFSGLGASIMTLMGNVKACVPSGPVRPYFLGGMGLFILRTDDGSVSGEGLVFPIEDYSENAFGFGVGAGAEFTVAPTVDLFVDGRFVLGFTEDESTSILPVRAGVKIKL